MQRRGLGALDFFEPVGNTYGADDDPIQPDNYTVYVPANRFQLSNDAFSQLRRTIDPLAPSSNFEIELYLQTLAYITSLT